jgi:hypothetical protein
LCVPEVPSEDLCRRTALEAICDAGRATTVLKTQFIGTSVVRAFYLFDTQQSCRWSLTFRSLLIMAAAWMAAQRPPNPLPSISHSSSKRVDPSRSHPYPCIIASACSLRPGSTPIFLPTMHAQTASRCLTRGQVHKQCCAASTDFFLLRMLALERRLNKATAKQTSFQFTLAIVPELASRERTNSVVAPRALG